MRDITVGKAFKWSAAATFVVGSFYCGDGNPITGAAYIANELSAIPLVIMFLVSNGVMSSAPKNPDVLIAGMIIGAGGMKLFDWAKEKMHNTLQTDVPPMENTGRFR